MQKLDGDTLFFIFLVVHDTFCFSLSHTIVFVSPKSCLGPGWLNYRVDANDASKRALPNSTIFFDRSTPETMIRAIFVYI